MQLFYNPSLNEKTTSIAFDKQESRHIVRVLRKKEGDVLTITDGNSGLYQAEISVANDKSCLAKIISYEQIEKPWNYYLHLAVAPTKNNDRFEWFLEKATEIGIDEITPIICKNSERKVIKEERFQKILVSAMKQSLKYNLPKLNSPKKFEDFINQKFEGIACIAHCEESKKESLKSVLKNKNKITVLIGPEGDFSPEEIKMALKNKLQPITLGNSRLRTETAAIVASHTVSVILS